MGIMVLLKNMSTNTLIGKIEVLKFTNLSLC